MLLLCKVNLEPSVWIQPSIPIDVPTPNSFFSDTKWAAPIFLIPVHAATENLVCKLVRKMGLCSIMRIIENINLRCWKLLVTVSLNEHSGCRICCSKFFPKDHRKAHITSSCLCLLWPASNPPVALCCISSVNNASMSL